MKEYITFEEFVKYVEKNILIGWRDEKELRIEKVTKNNGLILTGLVIYQDYANIAPTLYLEEAYGDYCLGMSLPAVMEKIRHQYEEFEDMMDIKDVDFFDYEQVKDQIIFRLVNYEKNKELLADCPYIRLYDLAVTFRCLMMFESSMVSSALVNNALIRDWGITREELILIARENTRRIFPEQVMAMSEMDEDAADEFDMIYVATNNHMLNGASVILYDGILEQYARKLGGDYYVIPSSMHEVLFIPKDMIGCQENLKYFVKEINDSMVDPQDVLSNSIYMYNAQDRALTCLR